MSRRGREDEPFLFDLPLTPEGTDGSEDGPGRPAGAAADPPAAPLPDDLFAEPAPDRPPSRPAAGPEADDPLGWDVVERQRDRELPASAPASAAAPRRPGLLPRLVAAAVDSLLLATVGGVALVGAVLLDAPAGLALLPGLTLLLLVFSFAYSVIPLAFWGATPGMAAAHLVARDRDGGPLTFGQTALRWLGGLLTALFAGLPLLLALRGLGARSPADRLSRSLTWLRR